MLKFEISRGAGRPAEWTGFVPTAGLVHSPRSVFERAIPLTGRVGSEPPTSARTAASAGSRDGRPGVSLEVAMVFQPALSGGPGLDATVTERRQEAPKATTKAVHSGFARSPLHPDLRRIPPEAGELVVHCLRARNLRLSRNINLSPKVVLTAVPDGEEAETTTPNTGPGGRHPVWGQVRTCTVLTTGPGPFVFHYFRSHTIFWLNIGCFTQRRALATVPLCVISVLLASTAPLSVAADPHPVYRGCRHSTGHCTSAKRHPTRGRQRCRRSGAIRGRDYSS